MTPVPEHYFAEINETRILEPYEMQKVYEDATRVVFRVPVPEAIPTQQDRGAFLNPALGVPYKPE